MELDDKIFFDVADFIIRELEYKDNFKRQLILMSTNKFNPIIEKDIVDVINYLLDNHYMVYAFNNRNILSITPNGRNVIRMGGFGIKMQTELDKKKKELIKEREESEKRKYDLKNSKRIFKTYWWTFGMSIFAFIISLILGYLKLAEVIKIWPYN